uniref:Uncharacterized protein n=1 Tax=Tanacetum cinerariifolium TaxID=118510 RepID=A0A699IEV9_TANCI|nr:hypothetical protein [Tanacetum cinerariifolium]
MEEFATNDKANYYTGITSIMVNGKKAYELKSKFLDDLCDNAFSGTNGEDAVEHVDYFLKIVDPINLPNDYEWYNELADGNLKEEAHKQKAIYEKSWGDASQSVTNFCAWLKRSYGNFHKLDYELLVKLQEYWWKVNDRECSPFSNWRNHIQGPYANYYSNFLDKEEHEDKYKHGLFDGQKQLVCNIRRFEMIKYSFDKDEEYVAVKEHEYDNLTSTNEDACRTTKKYFVGWTKGGW